VICQRVLVIGLGLIGGSFARALKEHDCCAEVLGNSRSADTVAKAQARGVVDRADVDLDVLLPELQAGDVVVVATPTLSVKATLSRLSDVVARGVIITDVASVKGSVVADALDVFGCVPDCLVPGHPIAGSEKSGIDAADPSLFQRHAVILTPLEHTDPAAVSTVTQLWEVAGAEVSSMPVAEHDAVLALTSHLPHMLAYTLVDTLAQRKQQDDIFRYAAGGFRDFTRIAGSDPTMWHDIALANREALLNGLDDFAQHLAGLRDAIASGNGEHLRDVFARAKQARDHFGELYARRKPDLR
jgi:prephenate dehydrogenase